MGSVDDRAPARWESLWRRRWHEAREAARSSDFDALVDLGSEANRRIQLLLVGSLCTIGAVVATIVLLPYADRLGFPPGTILIGGAAAGALGIAALALPPRIPMLAVDGVVAGGVIVITAAVSIAPQPLAGFIYLLYAWPIMTLVILRSERATISHFAFMGVTAGAMFVVDDSFRYGWFWTFILVVVMTGIWHSWGWIVRKARALAVAERSARARAEQASVALTQASEQNSRFLAAMSHELRTPLNAVVGFAEMLRRRVAGPLNDDQVDYVDDIVDSGRHLLALIDDTLDEAQVESGDVTLDLGVVDVADLVDDAVRLVRVRADAAGLELDVKVPQAGVITADERKVRQVLVNLLSNAVKFTPPGGSIRVTVEPTGGGVAFSVSDTGPGIDPDHHTSIFEEFRQTDRGASRHEGTGLGLALSRALVELHGGRIWVESRPGAGARFTFALPSVPRRSVSSAGTEHRGPSEPLPHPDLVTADDVIERTRRYALFTVVGAAVGVFVPDMPASARVYLVGAVAYALGFIGLMTWRPAIFSDRVFLTLMLVAAAVTGLGAAVGLAILGPYGSLAAYVWFGIDIIYRLSALAGGYRGIGWYNTAGAGVALAVALAAGSGNDAPVAQWAIVIGTFALAGFLYQWVLARLRMVATAEAEAADRAARVAAELDAAARHKSQFLAGMSHELRTPLNAVIGFAEMLERELPGPLSEQQREYVENIVGAGRHLLAVINDVLDLAKIDAGRLELSRREVEVDAVVDAVVARVQATTDGHIEVRHPQDAGALVLADDTRLAQALERLVANAVRFSPDDAAITVSVSRGDGSVHIAVTDTGPGIAEADHESIFEEFRRTDADPFRAGEGAGLGLPLARRLVELHGGSVRVESAPGEGATFTIALPEQAPGRSHDEQTSRLVAEGS